MHDSLARTRRSKCLSSNFLRNFRTHAEPAAEPAAPLIIATCLIHHLDIQCFTTLHNSLASYEVMQCYGCIPKTHWSKVSPRDNLLQTKVSKRTSFAATIVYAESFHASFANKQLTVSLSSRETMDTMGNSHGASGQHGPASCEGMSKNNSCKSIKH